MKRFSIVALATCAGITAGMAQSMNDQIVADLQNKGYGYIEIKNGPTQTKVEAIRGSDKLEVVYDNSTGSILKQEREAADADEIGLAGVDISRRNRSFVDDDDRRDGSSDDDDDRDDDDRDGRDDDDRDDDDRGGRDDDRDDDGSDDDEDDDDDDDSDDDDDEDDDDDDDDEDDD